MPLENKLKNFVIQNVMEKWNEENNKFLMDFGFKKDILKHSKKIPATRLGGYLGFTLDYNPHFPREVIESVYLVSRQKEDAEVLIENIFGKIKRGIYLDLVVNGDNNSITCGNPFFRYYINTKEAQGLSKDTKQLHELLDRDYFIRKDGKKPILVVSIHSCHAENQDNPRRRKEATLTKELNEMLHEKLGYYSFIYTGFRKRCKKYKKSCGCTGNTRVPLTKMIKDMLNTYGKIGVICLHGRGKKYTVKNYPDSIFELGTLRGKSLDFKIATDLWKKLGNKRIVFDYNTHFTGGGEIRILHREFNDSGYQRGQFTEGKDPRDNLLQIAQLEFDEWRTDEEWVIDGVNQKFYSCKVLGEIMCDYFV